MLLMLCHMAFVYHTEELPYGTGINIFIPYQTSSKSWMGLSQMLHLFTSSIDLDGVEKGRVCVKSTPEGPNVGFLGTDDKV